MRWHKQLIFAALLTATCCVTPAYARPGDLVSKEQQKAILGMAWGPVLDQTSCYIELFGEKVVNGPCVLRVARVKDAACTGYFMFAGHFKSEFRDEVPVAVVCKRLGDGGAGGQGFQITDDGNVIDLGLLTYNSGACIDNPSAKVCWHEKPLPPF